MNKPHGPAGWIIPSVITVLIACILSFAIALPMFSQNPHGALILIVSVFTLIMISAALLMYMGVGKE